MEGIFLHCVLRDESAFPHFVVLQVLRIRTRLGITLVTFNHHTISPFVRARLRQSSFPVGAFLASLSKRPFRCRSRVQISTDAQNARPTNRTPPIHKDAKNEDGAWVCSHSQRGKKWRPLTTSTPEGLGGKRGRARQIQVESSSHLTPAIVRMCQHILTLC